MTAEAPTRRKRGRPPLEDREWIFRSAGAQMIHESYRTEIAEERQAGDGHSEASLDGTPTELAYEATARDMGVSVETARDAVLNRRTKGRRRKGRQAGN